MTRLFAAAAVLALAAGCIGIGQTRVTGAGDVVRAERVVGPFKSIAVNGSADLHVNVGPHESVTVEAQPNIGDLIETTVHGRELSISQKEGYSTDKVVLVTVSVPRLDALSLRGESNAAIAGVRGDALALSIAGAGNVQASGDADRLTLDCSGAGNAELGRLAVRDAVVRLSGVGNARLTVSGTLDVEINGVGSVTYHGSPKIVHQEVHGVGSVSRD